MGQRYYQNLTLSEIFSDKKLRGKLPLISYKEGTTDTGRFSQQTNVKSVSSLVYDKARASARPFYKPLNASKSGNYIVLDGKTDTPLSTIVDVVYGQMLSLKQMLIITANDTDMIRSAIKESGRVRQKGGKEPKLYLRVGSLQQIEGMSNRERNKLINDIMKNLFFGGDFPETQKKFGVDKMFSQGRSYEQRKKEWLREINEQ